MGASLAGGFLVDAGRLFHQEYAGYLVLFLAAVACGLMAFRYIRLQPDPLPRQADPGPFPEFFRRPFQDPNFRRILLFYMYWLLAVGVASPFFSAHLIKNMHWDFRSLALLSIISTAAAIACTTFWGRMIDRFGHCPVLKITAASIIHLPLYYAFCPAGFLWPVFFDAVLSGGLWSGFNLAVFSLLIYALPASGRTMYIALASALSGLVNFGASALGGLVAQALSGWQREFNGLIIVNYQLLFVASTLLRVPGLLLLRRIREPEARHTALLIREAFLEVQRLMLFGKQLLPRPANKDGRGGRRSV
jgi:predicted MFS family arabinose efflux permease